MRTALVDQYVKVHPSLVGAGSSDSSNAPSEPRALIPLKVVERPDPPCPPKGLLIDVKAIGLNYAGGLHGKSAGLG